MAELKKPELMRQFGMIIENVDGFDQPGVLRGVPHTLALSTSITPPPGFPLVNTTGWSGDGAPGDGSLRSFATGAVIQHFPRTLDRIPGIDFRLPTEDELDALEAFQLSLGRNDELDLAALTFTSPLAERGKELFNSTAEGTGNCIACHGNAGANAANLIGEIQLEPTEVLSIAAFCRAINAIENIRNSNQLDQNAKKADLVDGARILANSIADIDDAIEVLTGGVFLINPDAVRLLEKARRILMQSQQFGDRFFRNFYINFATQLKNEARSLIVFEG